jgi:hypothetical protein
MTRAASLSLPTAFVVPAKLSEAASSRHQFPRFGIRCEERLQRRVVVVSEVRAQVARKRGGLEELDLERVNAISVA